jgi:hypothetical protein
LHHSSKTYEEARDKGHFNAFHENIEEVARFIAKNCKHFNTRSYNSVSSQSVKTGQDGSVTVSESTKRQKIDYKDNQKFFFGAQHGLVETLYMLVKAV